MDEIVELIKCKRCSLEKPAHKTSRHLCDDCVKAEDSRVSYYRTQNFDWMELAKDIDLEVWERQPNETDLEWSVWLAYRDAYPGRKPSYRQVAEDLTTSINAVRKVGNRWTFPARMQAWAKYVDDITLKQRTEEIVGMNARHISMADAINSKLEKAIQMIDPATLSAADIKGLYKTATEIERKARIDNPVETGALVAEDDNPNLKKTDVKSSDITEILSVLSGAGLLNNAGVRQTVTTEVVVKDD